MNDLFSVTVAYADLQGETTDDGLPTLRTTEAKPLQVDETVRAALIAGNED